MENEHLELKSLDSEGLYRTVAAFADGDAFESMRSIEQGLTFEGARAEFGRHGVEFSPEKFAALGMVSVKDGAFTNLALLLSDQCRHTTKIAVFSDDERRSRSCSA